MEPARSFATSEPGETTRARPLSSDSELVAGLDSARVQRAATIVHCC